MYPDALLMLLPGNTTTNAYMLGLLAIVVLPGKSINNVCGTIHIATTIHVCRTSALQFHRKSFS